MYSFSFYYGGRLITAVTTEIMASNSRMIANIFYLRLSKNESCSLPNFFPLIDFIGLTVIFASSLTLPINKG